MNIQEEFHQMGRGLNFSDNKTGMKVIDQSTLTHAQPNVKSWKCDIDVSGLKNVNLQKESFVVKNFTQVFPSLDTM